MEFTVSFQPGPDFGLDVQIPTPGREPFIGLTGPSGAGKSTLLRCLAGLEDQAIVSGSWQSLGWAEARVGLVFQESLLFPHLSVKQNLLLATSYSREHTYQFDDVVTGCQCHHLLHRMPASLSGGEAQRVALARAILNGPDILLLDEPVSALDTHTRHAILSYLRRLATAGLPMILVSHDLSDLSVYCPSLIYIEAGRCVFYDSTVKVLEEVYQHRKITSASRFGVLRGPVIATHSEGLVEFCCEGQSLFAEYPFIHNEEVALSIGEAAVTIDREWNAATSATNCFVCMVEVLKPEDNGHFQVCLSCGQTRLYARLNKIAQAQLNLQPGEQVAARFATHSFDAT